MWPYFLILGQNTNVLICRFPPHRRPAAPALSTKTQSTSQVRWSSFLCQLNSCLSPDWQSRWPEESGYSEYVGDGVQQEERNHQRLAEPRRLRRVQAAAAKDPSVHPPARPQAGAGGEPRQNFGSGRNKWLALMNSCARKQPKRIGKHSKYLFPLPCTTLHCTVQGCGAARPLPPLPGGATNKSVRFSLPGGGGQQPSSEGSDQGYESDQSRVRTALKCPVSTLLTVGYQIEETRALSLPVNFVPSARNSREVLVISVFL